MSTNPKTKPAKVEAAPAVKLDSLISSDDAEWVDLNEVPGVSLLVRPIDYSPYTQDRTKLFQRLARAYKKEPVPDKVRATQLGALYARHLLLGWKGFDVEYSQEEAENRLTDWSYRKLTSLVEWAASSLTDINAEMVEDAAKNSEVPSATS